MRHPLYPCRHSKMQVMTKSIKSGTRGFAPTRRQLISGSALAIGGLIIHSAAGAQPPNQVISHSEDSIHQEPVFAASRKRVYEALTSAAQFDKVIQLSGVMQTAVMASMKKPTEISLHQGGAFALFGGNCRMQIELVPDELIVQAWRVGNSGPRHLLDSSIRSSRAGRRHQDPV